MSAWYVFAAMGIFPQDPGRAEMLLGSPVFTRVSIDRGNGVRLTINANTTDTYVQSVRFNGLARGQSWLPESFVQQAERSRSPSARPPTRPGRPPPADLPQDH